MAQLHAIKKSFLTRPDISGAGSARSQIMLVEDNSYDYHAINRIFESLPVNIIWIRTAEEAWLKLKISSEELDLVICDYQLPAMSGLDLVKQIHKNQCSVPVVMLTGKGDESVAIEALKSGVYDYLIKDVEGQYLKAMPVKLANAISHYNDLVIKKNNEDELAVAANVFTHTIGAIMVTSKDNRIERVNNAFSESTGYTEQEVIGQNPSLLASGLHGPEFFKRMWEQINATGSWKGEIWNRRKNGSILPEWLVVNAINDQAGNLTHYIAIYTDITQLKEKQTKLRRYAYFDALTKLPNRTFFLEHLKNEIISHKRNQSCLGLMFIDLDDFKSINDDYGHLIGDNYLKIVGQRLSDSTRQSDTVARYAGDEFVVMLPQIKSPENLALIAEKILDHLAEPFKLDSQTLSIAVSIGISVYPGDGVNAQTLIKNADAAMYRSKQTGGHTYHFFTRDIELANQARIKRTQELEESILNQQLEMLYQPFVDIQTGLIIGAEALVRWNHPNLGIQSPDSFIPLAEQTGLIIPLSRLILEHVFKQTKQWQDEGVHLSTVSINLSKDYMKSIDLTSEINELVNKTRVDISSLAFEIKESVMIDQQQKMISTLETLKNLGFKLLMDGFGVKYSALSEMKHFPLHQWKIPRSFIQGILTDPHSTALSESIIKMGHSLNLKVIAEGIETEQQLQFLKQQNCDVGQGFFWSKGLKGAQLTSLLKNQMSS